MLYVLGRYHCRRQWWKFAAHFVQRLRLLDGRYRSSTVVETCDVADSGVTPLTALRARVDCSTVSDTKMSSLHYRIDDTS